MFERYQRGTNAVIDALATAYDRLRSTAQGLDERTAQCVDQVRRRRRRVERVERLDQTITDTMSVFGDLEREVGSAAAVDLRETRRHLQFVLTTLRS